VLPEPSEFISGTVLLKPLNMRTQKTMFCHLFCKGTMGLSVLPLHLELLGSLFDGVSWFKPLCGFRNQQDYFFLLVGAIALQGHDASSCHTASWRCSTAPFTMNSKHA